MDRDLQRQKLPRRCLLLMQWGIKKVVITIVFDTNTSNTGAEIGAFRCLELWIDGLAVAVHPGSHGNDQRSWCGSLHGV